MKPAGPLKHVVIAFLIALVIYVVFYSGDKYYRTRNGPWQVAFTNVAGAATLIINEPKLNLSDVRISFPGQPPATNNLVTNFSEPRDVPFAVPFGECIYMDTMYQPGAVAFRLFGHEIQLIPRVLIIDKQEHPWKSGSTIEVAR